MSYRYFIQLSYNGSAYCGWQKQPNAVSVQHWIERGLDSIAGVDAGVTGCGRTDAGVHAGKFFAHFDFGEALSAEAMLQLVFRLNRFLPDDISVSEISPVVPGAHARFSATWREYEYLILRRKDPFNFQKAYMLHGDLNIASMNASSSMLIGKHDFESFSKVHTEVNNFICTVQSANWVEDGHYLKFTIRADRFLRNMVRAIVGTLLDVGRGKTSPDDFQKIMDSHNRGAAGFSVPARGLTLTGIGYPEEIFTKEPVSFSPESGEKIISHYYTDTEFHKGSGDKPDK